jgi:hypothetical protein
MPRCGWKPGDAAGRSDLHPETLMRCLRETENPRRAVGALVRWPRIRARELEGVMKAVRALAQPPEIEFGPRKILDGTSEIDFRGLKIDFRVGKINFKAGEIDFLD